MRIILSYVDNIMTLNSYALSILEKRNLASNKNGTMLVAFNEIFTE